MTDQRHPMLTNLKEANPDLSEAHLDEIHTLMSRTLEVAPHVGHLARHAGDLTRALAAVAGRLFYRAADGEDLGVEDRAALQQAFFAGWRPTYANHVTGDGGVLVSCFVPGEESTPGTLVVHHAVLTGRWTGPRRRDGTFDLILPLTAHHERIRLPRLFEADDDRAYLPGHELMLDRRGLYFEAVSGFLLYNPRDWLDEMRDAIGDEPRAWLDAHPDWPPETLHPMGGPDN